MFTLYQVILYFAFTAHYLYLKKRKNLNTFVNFGCSDCCNIIERQSIHVERQYHKDAIKDSHNLINRFEKPEVTIDYHSDTAYHERYNKHSKILEFIARTINFHGRQGLDLRGHRETLQESDENQNFGSFLTYLKELQKFCHELKEHLQTPQSKSITYLCPTSQNEMIGVIGKKIILRDIVEEIKKIGLPQCFCRRNNF